MDCEGVSDRDAHEGELDKPFLAMESDAGFQNI